MQAYGMAHKWGTKACKHSGLGVLLRVSNGNCALCNRERMKAWKEANQDYVKRSHKELYQRDRVKRLAQTKAWQAANKDRVAENRRRWARENADRVRKLGTQHWRRRNGIVWAPGWDEARLREACGNACQSCGRVDRPLCVDHDHAITDGSPNVRGLLCSGCNTSIGQLGDTVESLERALAYLRRGVLLPR